jgi:hypothetical protein
MNNSVTHVTLSVLYYMNCVQWHKLFQEILRLVSWDRCYDLKNIFAKKIGEKNWRFFLKTKLNYEKIDHNIDF